MTKWHTEPPKHNNIVIVHWKGYSSLGERLLGQYFEKQDTWTVYGLGSVHAGRRDVERWTELPKLPKT